MTPEDKLRLARTMQEQGLIVAMTGDAVNDAAALKQADIGVAMGSGSEVTKQAARMVLTDDNFGTLVHAVEIGRRVYDKVVSYVRYQMTQLLSLVLLFLAATVFDINEGVALTPPMVLYLLFFATAAGVVIIAVDPGDPDVMHRPPRDPAVPITNRPAVMTGSSTPRCCSSPRCVPLVAGPDEPRTDQAQRLDDDDLRGDGPRHGRSTPWSTAATRRAASRPDRSRRSRSRLVPVALLFLATQLPTLQQALLTTPLTGRQWLVCVGLAALLPIVVEVGKVVRRRRRQPPAPLDPAVVVSPARAVRHRRASPTP